MAQCALAAGFLVMRQCENAAMGACGECGRPICFVHTVVSERGTLCTVCSANEGEYYDEDEMYDADADGGGDEDAASDDADVFTEDDDELFQAGDAEDGELS